MIDFFMKIFAKIRIYYAHKNKKELTRKTIKKDNLLSWLASCFVPHAENPVSNPATSF